MEPKLAAVNGAKRDSGNRWTASVSLLLTLWTRTEFLWSLHISGPAWGEANTNIAGIVWHFVVFFFIWIDIWNQWFFPPYLSGSNKSYKYFLPFWIVCVDLWVCRVWLCTRAVSQLYLDCITAVLGIYQSCTWAVTKLFLGFIRAVLGLYKTCAWAVSQLYLGFLTAVLGL